MMDEGFISILFLVVCFSVWLSFTYKRYSRCKLCLFFLSFYFISSLSSLLFYYAFKEIINIYSYDNIHILPFLYWLVSFALILFPVFKYENSKITGITYNIKFVHQVSILGLLLSIIPLMEILPVIGELFGSGSSDSLAEMHDESEKVEYLSSVSRFLIRGSWALYDLSFLLLFPLLRERKKNYMAISGVLMVLLTCTLRTVSTAGRGGLFRFLVHIIVLFLLFIPFLNGKDKKVLKRVGGGLTVVMLSFFVFITLSRSSNHTERNEDYTLAAYMVRYAGEGFCNYSNYSFNAKEPLYGVYTMYLPRLVLGMETPDISRDYLYNTAERIQQIPQNIFYTFIGIFVIDLGPFWAFMFVVFIFVNGMIIVKRKGTIIPMRYLFLFSVYLKILEFGPIGYVYPGSANIYIMIYAFLFYLMKLNRT